MYDLRKYLSIDLRPTRLNSILQDLFRKTPLDHIWLTNMRQKCIFGHIWHLCFGVVLQSKKYKMSHSGERFISIHHLNYYLYCIITMLSSLFIIIYFSTSTVGELRGQIFTTVRLNSIQHLHYHCHCMYYKDNIFIYIKYQNI